MVDNIPSHDSGLPNLVVVLYNTTEIVDAQSCDVVDDVYSLTDKWCLSFLSIDAHMCIAPLS